MSVLSRKSLTVWETERLHHSHVPWYGKKTVLEHEERYRFVISYIQNKVVVDLGCGSGYGTFLFAQRGAKKVYGIDLSVQAIKLAKKQYSHKKIKYKVADVTNTKLSSGIADIIISFEVIEHLGNPKDFLQEVQRLLKPGGIFIMSTPNAFASFDDNPWHIHEFGLQELKRLLSVFKKVTFFGQRKVDKKVITMYKYASFFIKHPALRMFLRFRPWEHYTIHPINNPSNVYLYFLTVCQKK